MNNDTIVYARLSREDEDKLDGKIESRSIENQIKLLTKYANEHGFKIVKVLYDDGYSGGTMDRPAFNELLKEVRNGSFKVLLVKDFSRLGRVMYAVGDFVENVLPSHNIRLISVDDKYDSNDTQNDNDLSAVIKYFMNEYNLKDFKRKCRDARIHYANTKHLNYYPKFGFRPAKEYEYYLEIGQNGVKTGKCNGAAPYQIQPVDINVPAQAEKLYAFIREYPDCSPAGEEDVSATADDGQNQNDGLYMSENISLYQFWLAAGFGEQMYYLPETGTYVMAETDGEVLRVNQIFGKQPVDMMRLAAAFGGNIREVVLGYTPAHKDGFLVREHKEEDCTLFILGEDLERIERETMMFPVLSHA